MKIIILGAGQVGGTLAEHLASEANDITVVDTDSERLRNLGDRLDIRTVQGRASFPTVLRQAGADDADMLVAVTNSDETNMVACQVAHTLFHTPTKIARVRENLERLGLSAELIAADGRDTATWWDGKPFQRILLDAPCSATGVIRRHPDIKLTRQPDDIAALATLQGELLDAMWPTLEVGGILLYATCSTLPTENTDVIEAFLARTPGARELDIAGQFGIKQPHGRQLLAQEGGHDGFYYAKLIKIAAARG